MEDPKRELGGVVEAIVQNRDLELQRRTFYKYFTADCTLKHPLCSSLNLSGIVAIFDLRARVLIHWSTDVISTYYNPEEDPNKIVVHLIQHMRPIWRFWRASAHSTIALVMLRDEKDPSTGKTVKKICKQFDHMNQSMPLAEAPIIGGFYEWGLDHGVIGGVLGLIDPVIVKVSIMGKRALSQIKTE